MNLKKYRLKEELRQEDMANALKIKRATYANYENGNTEPTIEILIKLADFFHISIDELVERDFNLKLTKQEQELLEKVKQLTPIEFGKVIGYVDNMIKYKQEEKRQIFFNSLNNKENEGE